MYPDDKNGIPVIDAYESFTSEAFGLTASTHVDGSAQFASLTQIVANRVDRNTVKISWNYSGVSEYNKVNLYDSFVVMKVVNGIRGFVGRTFKNFIYHELSEEDIGTAYYIVVPIMAEFDIDSPGYSNSLLLTPEGLTTRLMAVKLTAGHDVTDSLKSVQAGALPKLSDTSIKSMIDDLTNNPQQDDVRKVTTTVVPKKRW